MPLKILPFIIYSCDACLDVEMTVQEIFPDHIQYVCPSCGLESSRDLLFPLNVAGTEMANLLDEKVILFNQDQGASNLFSITIPACDRYTRNLIFHLFKIGLHASRGQLAGTKNAKRPEIAAAIGLLEDVLIKMATIGNINYDAANMPDIKINEEKYTKFNLPILKPANKNGKQKKRIH